MGGEDLVDADADMVDTVDNAGDVPTGMRKWGIPLVFTLTSFLGASLLFVVQPLMSKLLLPSFGGSEAVWTTAAFFFQLILLVSYVIVHATVRFGPRFQSSALAPFALAALFFVPIALPDGFNGIPEGVAPVWILLGTLAVVIGLPFTVLAMTGPLLSKWYSWTDAVRREDPFFMYAASNAGSFIGLFSYPFVIEPFVSLDAQLHLWTSGFIVFLVLMVACAGITQWRNRVSSVSDADVEAASAGVFVGGVSWRRRVYWVALAFIPSSLYLGATSFLTTDIAAFPMVWVFPLGIYLASMVVAFARVERHVIPKTTYAAAGTGLIMLLLTVSDVGLYILAVSVPLVLVSLALISHAAHVQLAADRPEPKHLTEFFVWVSVGGALGGLFNSVIAPLLLSDTLEYPLVLASSVLLLIVVRPEKRARFLTVFALSASFTVLSSYVSFSGGVLHKDRTFYGTYQVLEEQNAEGETEHLFVHGSTLHNTQNMDSPGEPTNYYSREGSGLGVLMGVYDPENVFVAGAGTGAVSAYADEGDEYTFVEIDGAVLDIATDPELFTYFEDADGSVDLQVGDGRIVSRSLEEQSQDLVVLDAFSSISVPTHLLTREAFDDYERVLADDGVMAVNVSNRVLDLVPVVASAADHLGVEGRVFSTEDSTWVVLTGDEQVLGGLDAQGSMESRDLAGVDRVEWSDDFSSVLDVLDGEKIMGSWF